MRRIAGLGVCVVLGIAGAAAQPAAPASETPSKAWISVSDAYTQQLLAVQLKHHPEGGSAEGLAQFDEQVSNPTLADFQAERSETEALLPKLKAASATEQRFTYRAPGQANSYFYGYTKLLQLRKDAQAALGPKFDALKFHDFLLAQGLLPPDLLRQAVMNDFVPSQR